GPVQARAPHGHARWRRRAPRAAGGDGRRVLPPPRHPLRPPARAPQRQAPAVVVGKDCGDKSPQMDKLDSRADGRYIPGRNERPTSTPGGPMASRAAVLQERYPMSLTLPPEFERAVRERVGTANYETAWDVFVSCIGAA